MPDIIHLLPDSVANQIAAGEVIQRPANVIKELVENAVDAGATEISIFIKDAGKTLIQVIDNGKGMTETDARMAFERHATSKISAATDLFTLTTMGFRGEALPSICAISQVELRTRTENDRLGTCLKINCSQYESQETCVCAQGANLMVRNLFCNVPARRKFLKSDATELANIMQEFKRLALVNTGVRLSIDTGSQKLDLLPGSFKQRIGDIWKNNLNLQLIPVEVETPVVKISGFVSRPEFARRRNPLQYLIVNGRNMNHLYLRKAVLSCFENLIAPDTQPCFFIRFEVDPATIDVNISPTKSEIKFEQEQEVWRILSAAVRAALGKFSAVPSIDFSNDVLPATPINPGETVVPPKMDFNPDYNPFAGTPATPPAGFTPTGFSPAGSSPSRGNFSPRQKNSAVGQSWEKLYDSFMNDARHEKKTQPQPEQQDQLFDDAGKSDNRPICLQHARKYIVTPAAEGLLVIDQHRAHVRVLYDEFLRHAHNDSAVTQQIIFPETLTLDPAQQLILEGMEDELSRIGFILEPTGNGSWLIKGVPAVLVHSDPKDIILRIIDSVSDDSVNYGNEAEPAEAMLQRVALIMARSAAITRGQLLSASEMEHLVSRLVSLPDASLTPNGNPVMRIIKDDDIAAMFR